MTVTVVRTSEVPKSARVLQVNGMMDVPSWERVTLRFTAHLPIEERDWHVGLIVGPSGSGKTSLVRTAFGEPYVPEWPDKKALVDAFTVKMSVKEVVALLTAVGLSSVPAWLRPYSTLSTGEAFRANVARTLAECPDLAVVDEWTSTVDRQIAQLASHTAQKAIRRRGQKLIAVTCHYDVQDWLQPDWVYDTGTHTFSWRSLQRHPEVQFEVRAADRSAWSTFSRYHYMSGFLVANAKCLVATLNTVPAAFSAYRHLPHPKAKDIMIGHRTVVLPDFQGFGLGGTLQTVIGEHVTKLKMRFHTATAHPAMIAHYKKSPHWRYLHRGGAASGKTADSHIKRSQSDPRTLAVTYWQYVP